MNRNDVNEEIGGRLDNRKCDACKRMMIASTNETRSPPYLCSRKDCVARRNA